MRNTLYTGIVLLVGCGDTTKSPDTQKPIFTSPDRVEVFENQSNVITLKAKDAGSVTYSISGADSMLFGVEEHSGIVYFKILPDFEEKKRYHFVAKATDASGNESEQNMTIEIKDIKNEYVYKKTGQIVSYDENGKQINEGTLKDDGFYQKGIEHNYTRSGDFVTDRITGLKWYDHNDSNNKKSWEEAIAYCDNLEIDTGNWRLASVDELMYIVNRSKSNPSIDKEKFNHIQGKDYWSSTEVKNKEERALGVNFELGYDHEFNKTYSAYIRCVKEES